MQDSTTAAAIGAAAASLGRRVLVAEDTGSGKWVGPAFYTAALLSAVAAAAAVAR